MWSRALLVFVQAVFGVAAHLVSTPAASTPATPAIPTAVHVHATAPVGALFTSTMANTHGCTGSVVHSQTRDTVLIAAHCGVSAGMLFAPGYDNGATPYGVWRISRVFLDRAWSAQRDPRADYAVLKIARQFRTGRRVGIEDVTGAYTLGTAPRPGTRLVVLGYLIGIRDRPIQCTVVSYATGVYPSFDCRGYSGGTSGSPWVLPATGAHTATVVGIIGGLDHGGRFDYTSYTSSFGPATTKLLAQASTS